jgi:hypothetical protein
MNAVVEKIFWDEEALAQYASIGTWRDGDGGLWEQMNHQGIDPDSIVARVRELT